MSDRSPPLNSLRVFEAAARHGSFARAGTELSITAAAVSHHVRELESSLNLSLFVRLARGVQLTDAGKRYETQVAHALDLIGQATRSLRETPIDGPVRISAPNSFAQLWLAPRLLQLTAQYPGLEPIIDADDRPVDVRKGQTDIALRFGSGTASGLCVEHLMNDAVSLLVARELVETNKPIADWLAEQTLLVDTGVSETEPWMSWAPWLREAGVAADDRTCVKMSNGALVLSACQSQVGVCISRVSLALPAIQQRALCVLTAWRSSDHAYHLLTRNEDKNNPRICAVRQWLHAQARLFTGHVTATTGHRLGLPRHRR